MIDHKAIEEFVRPVIGLTLFKSWNVFGTRMFYFALGTERYTAEDDGDCRITLECPWRLERGGRILVGFEDYGARATCNSDPAWNPDDLQTGHLQDEKLEQIFGEEIEGAIINRTAKLVVEAVRADEFGGFRINLSGDYSLVVFPTTDSAMEWLVSRRGFGTLSLTNGSLSRS